MDEHVQYVLAVVNLSGFDVAFVLPNGLSVLHHMDEH